MNGFDKGAYVVTVILLSLIIALGMLLSGCSTYRVETTEAGATVYGRGIYEQTVDGDIMIDTSSGNWFDNTKMIGMSVLEAVGGTMQRLGVTFGD